jgi:Flp pilus assembly protein TadD
MNSLGYILAENGVQLSTALDYCRRAFAQQPNNPSYLDSLAIALWRSGDHKRAKDAFERAVKMSNSRPEILAHYREFMSEGGAAS